MPRSSENFGIPAQCTSFRTYQSDNVLAEEWRRKSVCLYSSRFQATGSRLATSGPPNAHTKLYLDARPVATSDGGTCFAYSKECYREKLLRVFQIALNVSGDAPYLFFMEADNDLCVPLAEIERIATTYHRPWIGTGVGFSGVIMSRRFVEIWMETYQQIPSTDETNYYCPDCVVQLLLNDNVTDMTWSVTRQYLVQHTLALSVGSKALNHGDRKNNRLYKHLPRCLEPTREAWFGKGDWDYFDYNECGDEEIYPC